MNITKDNAFTVAFNAIARACIPHMDPKHAFFSDFLFDAERVARSPAGAVTYIVVRDCGTQTYTDLAGALEECDHAERVGHAGRVLIKATRSEWDNTSVERIAHGDGAPSAA